MEVHLPIAHSLVTERTTSPKNHSAWPATTFVALLALAAILLHLALRYLSNAPRTAWQAPLIVALIAGGLPLILRLTRKLLQREFGSDHLAGVSIIASAILGEYPEAMRTPKPPRS